jgi:hypothetical protein
MNKQERERLREFVKTVEPNDFVIKSSKLIALLEQIDALEGQIDELRNLDTPDSLSVYFMHDGHWFTELKGNTLDEILAHADAIESSEDGSYGMLCDITLLRGKREIRRVGPAVHARGSKDSKDKWNKGKAEWKAAAESDPDIQRILAKAAIASASEE